jgi:hypothetical protein
MTWRWLVVPVVFAACAHPPARQNAAVVPPAKVAVPAPPAPPGVDFVRDVRPILEARCQPCHFTGGRMYESLPFDREETVHRLGEKLFTRIKAEDERRLIRDLLSRAP